MRKMKDSGIEWINYIPNDWTVTRIGYESWVRARLGWKGLKAEEYVDEGFAFLSAFNIIDDKLQWENLNFINQQRYDESPEIKLKKGDILLVKDGAGIGKCARIDSLPIGAATTNGSLAVISTHAKLSYRYLYFYLLSPIFQNYIYRLMNGMGVPHLSQEELRKIQIPFPPLPEQKKIADFLDAKCADIDQIRADIEKQIEILTDYKKSIITEAVTKGLDPKAKMKDSGIEWIGKIPEHWETRRIKSLGSARNGLTYSPNDVCDETQGTLVLRSSNIQNGKLCFDDNVYVTCDIPQELKVREGDILVCSRNGSRKLIGKNAIIGNIDATYGAFMMVFRSNYSRYMFYVLNSNVFSYYLGSFFTSTINQLTGFDFGNMKITFCPNERERNMIVSYLDEKCSEIDATIAEKQKQLETLEEYKKSLIFEYVTGKKEVV